MFFDDFWDAWVEEGGMALAIENYVNADLRASFLGDYDDCINYAIATEAELKEWHESEKEYYAEALMWYADIDSTYMDEATQARFMEIAEKILAKSSWEFKDITADRFGGGTATMVIRPTNFFDIIVDGIASAIDEWNVKYETVDLDAISDTEYAVLELDYANMVLNAIESKTEEAAAGEAVELICDLDISNSVLTDDSWLNLYDALMGLYYEEEE